MLNVIVSYIVYIRGTKDYYNWSLSMIHYP